MSHQQSTDETPISTPTPTLAEAPEVLREIADTVESVIAAPPPVIINLGLFEDGTRADWADDAIAQTAVQRLSYDYIGECMYKGGPGTDLRGLIARTWETLTGAGRRERFQDFREKIKLTLVRNPGATLVADLFGWSRGGDEMIAFVPECIRLGVAVRFLGVFDPVPARGWRAAMRIIPLLPLPPAYPRPDVGMVFQILAGEEHSRLLRHARIKIDPTRGDGEEYVGGDHGDSARPAERDGKMREAAERAGVRWAVRASG